MRPLKPLLSGCTVDRDKKRDVLVHLIKEQNWSQVLVFTRTKHGANALAEKLVKADISTMAIHGNKSQTARTRALAEFKTGQLRVLVATDIAARGLDINQLPHVVNYELPDVAESYVHRIGRTGRAGATGTAISLVCVDEFKLLQDIERFIKTEIEQHTLAGFEPDRNAKPQPIQLRSPGMHGGQRQNRGQGNGAAKTAISQNKPVSTPRASQGRRIQNANQSQSRNHSTRGEINGNTWETVTPGTTAAISHRQNSGRPRTASKPSISQHHSRVTHARSNGQSRRRSES